MSHAPMTPEEALPAIRAALTAGRPCSLTVTGGSMLPFLRPRTDAVILVPVDRPFRPGQILFYLRGEAQCVLHRIHRILPDGTLLLCGDAQAALEPVSPDRVIACVSHVQRNGRLIDCRRPTLRLAVWLWRLLRPVRPRLLQGLLRVRQWIKK